MQTIQDVLMKPKFCEWSVEVVPADKKKAKIKIACEIVVSFTQNIFIFGKFLKF